MPRLTQHTSQGKEVGDSKATHRLARRLVEKRHDGSWSRPLYAQAHRPGGKKQDESQRDCELDIACEERNT